MEITVKTAEQLRLTAKNLSLSNKNLDERQTSMSYVLSVACGASIAVIKTLLSG
jgi:hypothetical protein